MKMYCFLNCLTYNKKGEGVIIMICILSNRLVDYLERCLCLKEDKEIYIYGAELLISSMIGTVLLLFIGFVSHHFVEAIIYEILISSSRSILGGYHCKNYYTCIFSYLIIFMSDLLFIQYFIININQLIFIEILGLLVTIFNCPIDNINKKCTLKKRKIFKGYSVFYITIYIIIMNIMFLFHINYIQIIIYIFININILTLGGRLNYEICQR